MASPVQCLWNLFQFLSSFLPIGLLLLSCPCPTGAENCANYSVVPLGGHTSSQGPLNGGACETMEADPNVEEPGATISQDLYIVMPPGYNRFKMPWRTNSSPQEPLEVDVYFAIKKVLGFDELQEQITYEIDMIVSWTDFKILEYRMNQTYDGKPGKSIDDMTLDEINKKRRVINNPSTFDEIWKPNIFFENLISSSQPFAMSKAVKLKVVPEAGYIQYASRLTVTVDCGMVFQYYPADTQSCEFSLRPYSYTSKLVRLKWHKNEGPFLEDTTLQGFDIRIDDLHERNILDDWDDLTGMFHTLCFTVFVRRQLSYHLVQTYLASAFYIVITCLCFVLPTHMVEARIGISMTTLLTLTAMFAAVRTSTPITSYVKAVDIWMICCIFFVFLTLCQFTFYTWLRAAKEERLRIELEKKALQNGSGRGTPTHLPLPKIVGPPKETTLEKYEAVAFVIDRFSFPIFLSIFGLFVIIALTGSYVSPYVQHGMTDQYRETNDNCETNHNSNTNLKPHD